MDLPTFLLGRKTPSLGIWRRLRESQAESPLGPTKGVEPVSGLPRSLLDIFSHADEPGAAWQFYSWPGELGEFLQCQIWEAYRLAGILMSMRLYPDEYVPSVLTAHSQPRSSLPSREILINRILACVDAIKTDLNQSNKHELLVRNALIYPLFASALDIETLDKHPNWRCLIRQWILECNEVKRGKNVDLCWQTIEVLWKGDHNCRDVNEIATQIDIEISLW